MGIATYAVLNVAFLAVATIFAWPWLRRSKRHFVIICVHLLVMTAIFDSLIVWSGIVGYDASKILGLRIGTAPVEDFAYAVAAALLVPSVWHRVKKKKEDV